MMKGLGQGLGEGVQKNTLYVGGLAEEVNESILHAAFIPFGEIKYVKTPLDKATQKHRSFGFVTFLKREDASPAMDNLDGGEQGWAAQPASSSNERDGGLGVLIRNDKGDFVAAKSLFMNDRWDIKALEARGCSARFAACTSAESERHRGGNRLPQRCPCPGPQNSLLGLVFGYH